MAVIMDMNSKTIRKIEGIPYTDGHGVAIERYNAEKVLFSSYGEKASGIFSYDINTGKVKQELSLNSNVPFIHIFK